MRAGAFAEPRVIDLMNRRFVPFYYNTGGPGLGLDESAAAFVKGKVKNRWAHFSAWKPDGTYLAESEIYADKDGAFEYLMGLLRDNPEFNAMTPEEEKIIASGDDRRTARLYEELGDYDRAVKGYTAAREWPALARIARYSKDWKAHEELCAKLEGADAAMEVGHRLIAQEKYQEARDLLEPAIEAHPTSPRLSEMRFTAGVACWFLKERDRAYFHWCWVVENLPDDHLARRCYIAAAAEGMPYANPELAGYRMDSQFGSIDVIQAAYAKARETYEKLKGQRK